MIGFGFHEIMEGSAERAGERFDRPFRFEVDVRTPNVVARVATCTAEGFLRLDGLAKNAHATGHLEMSPWIERRIRYVLDFDSDDGKRFRFDGSKRIARFAASPQELLRSWTTLPARITDIAKDEPWGSALLRFHMAHDLRALVSSMRFGWSRALKSAHV